jgi:putative methyltransferase
VDQDICSGHLLVFPPFTDLHAHPLVLSGGLILQDKASAISGFVLGAPPGCTAIDAYVGGSREGGKIREERGRGGGRKGGEPIVYKG